MAQESTSDILKEKEAIEKSSRLHWVHWLIVGLSLALTLGAWYFTQAQVNEKTETQFEREAGRIVEQVIERMEKYEDALWSGVAAVYSQSHGIDYYEWKRFSDTLQIENKYPGINGIGVIYHVKPEHLSAYLEEQRKDRPDFKIHPAHNEKEFFPITYIEPVEINAAAVGLDMAHENNRYTAAKKSRDTGTAQITGPITLVQDAEKTPGFLFYAPFYKNGDTDTVQTRQENFTGMVYAPFIFKKLMLGTLEKERRHVGISIKDGEDVLYDEHKASNPDFDPNPLFEKVVTINIYGRQWVFKIFTKHSFRTATANNKPWMILIGGLVIDSLLLALFMFLAHSNRRAIKFAKKMADKEKSNAIMLKNIIENAVDGLITIDEKGSIETFNKACEGMFGYSSDEVIGKNIKVLMPEPYHSEHDGYLKNYHDTDNKKIIGIGREVEGKKKDDTIFPMDLSVSEVNIQGRRIYSGIVRDITERKKYEEEIIRSNEELERFAYIASHDLQEPLRMVSSFTGLLNEEYKETMDEQASKYMNFIIDASNRMQGLVADLLEYSRVGKEETGFSAFDGKAQTQYAIENLKESIEETSAKITFDEIPTLYANPMRFSRLMQNLIGNAIKYRSPDKAPEIHIGIEEREEDWLFSVRDNGLGIKEEYLEQIFILFKRLHNKKEYSGTGIGLAVCKKIVESFNGQLWVESKFGEGSVFYFTIPSLKH